MLFIDELLFILMLCEERYCIWYCMVFFFQAEDGIRDLVRSRGLGDVYKRQGWLRPTNGTSDYFNACLGVPFSESVPDNEFGYEPVSYTHLTLPTSDLV